jgi:hypothetical protein
MGLGRTPARVNWPLLVPMCSAILGLSAGTARSFEGSDRTAVPVGPAPFSTPENTPAPTEIGEPVESVWNDQSLLRGPGATLLYDNGPPLDDFGHPASQLSQSASPWGFIAAGADDFKFTDGPPSTAVRVTSVRVATHFFQTGAAGATPTTSWTGGVYVTVYADAAGSPSGQPNDTGGQSGTFVASQLVPMASLTNQSIVNTCRPAFLVDIPVNILLSKNTKYWLSVVPKFNAPPQSAWVISSIQNPATSTAMIGFPVASIAFWTPNPGNTASCAGAPALHTRRDLSFQLYGVATVAAFGACCDGNGQCSTVDSAAQCSGPLQTYTPGVTCQSLNPPCSTLTGACCDNAGVCTDNASISNCAPTSRFAPNTLCSALVPPCGDTTLGACCLPGGGCDDLSALDCDNAGGIYHTGTCATFACPPTNDKCVNKIAITSDTIVFDTTGATSEGPNDGNINCGTPMQDIWYSYTSPCTGTLSISLCEGTNFDTILAVYDGCACPPDQMGTRLACNDDACLTAGPSGVTLPVTQGNCYLIRVGGVGAATGPGVMHLSCVPTGSGACCHADHTCTIETPANCIQPDVFTPDQACSPITCPPPPTGACCFEPAPCQESLTEQECLLTGGVYVGDNSTCADPCPAPPTGACCLPSGSCEESLTSAQCFSDGGIFQGAGSQCNFVQCPPPIGACCSPNGTCQDLTLADCQAANGAYMGDRVLCASNPCPPGLGACCAAGQCLVLTSADCLGQQGIYQGVGTSCSASLCNNNLCANMIPLGEGTFFFDTTGATTDGPVDSTTPPCSTALNDIWFTHTSSCSGTLKIDLCPGTNYVAAMSVYPGTACPPLGPPLACDAGGCGPGQNTSISLGTSPGVIHTIRIGGVGGATGSGTIRIHCIPTFTCCPGDMNGDGAVNQADVQPFVNVLLGVQPAPGTLEFCRADVNVDNLINGRDVQSLIDVILGHSPPCTQLGACCYLDGHCETRFEQSCLDTGGTFNGIGIPCTPSLCTPIPMGACCIVGQACTVISESDCTTQSGDFHGENTVCSPSPCPPVNDGCDHALEVLEGDTPFTTVNATNSSQADSPGCPAPLADVWFRFVANCTGTLKIGLCPGTDFNARVSAYKDGDCANPSLANLYCSTVPNTGGCGFGQDTFASFSVTALDVIWIRVGSIDLTTGQGMLRIHCGPNIATDQCCPGDMDGNGIINLADISQFSSDLISPPPIGTLEFCHADINRDFAVNGLDVQEFINRFVGPNANAPCSYVGACCFSDGTCERRSSISCTNATGSYSAGTTCPPATPCTIATGACCMPNNSCSTQSFAGCLSSGGFYRGDNTSCAPNPCAPCCKGDVSADGILNGGDIAIFVQYLVMPPTSGTPEFCRADVNSDNSVNVADIQPFVDRLTSGATCP